MLMRFDPFRDLDRLTEQLWNESSRGAGRVMPMDAYRQGDEFFVHFDLPGVDAGSIDLTVEKNVLTVAAERTWQPQEGSQAVVSERFQGRFSRQLFLGETLDAENVKAAYHDGVLTLTIPVAERAKPRKVEVEMSEGQVAQTPPIETTSSKSSVA